MIIDMERFLTGERPYWVELERTLDKLEKDPLSRMDLEQVKRFHYLYQRTSADLAKIVTFASQPEIRRYLETLVGRAYGEVHETRARPHRFAPVRWFFQTFPQTFRRYIRQFLLSAAVTLVGFLFGGLAITVDPDAREIILPPYKHLMENPAERVAHEEEEQHKFDPQRGTKIVGTSFYFTHNTRISVILFAMGMTWGVGTLLVLFYNGVLLGAVGLDYVVAGQTRFVTGWLLPHGSIEIPAILIAGQASFVLASALIGWGSREPLRSRFRAVRNDLVTLMCGVAVLLTWAGFVESFLSQYHEPVIPYLAKIAFGLVELALLVVFLSRSGTQRAREIPTL